MSFIAFACLLFTACDKDEVLPGGPMDWTYEILTPENVKYEGSSADWSRKYCFKANGKEGDIVMTFTNFDTLDPISGDSYTYDCGWATLKVEANQLKIHFPYHVSEAPDEYEEIKISATDGKRKANTIICLSRTFKGKEEQPEPGTLPETAKFKMISSGFTPFMRLDTPLPAPLDLITFRITDVNDNYTPLGFPEYTQYYDSIVWSADELPHTFRIYENDVTAGGTERYFTSQWSSHFFRSGTIKTHLKGYCQGKVEYETSLDVNLYERDFLCIEWGYVVLQYPQNLTTYCLLDTTYEYQVNDIIANGEHPFSKIIPVNNKRLSHSDYMSAAQKAIKTLMETNVGHGQSAKGKESLFKCLPEKDVEAELYWENRTSRMVMLHQIPDDPDELIQEKYYLHIEPKQ